MKKLLILIVIVIAGLGIFYVLRDNSATNNSNNTADENGNFRPSPRNATFTFEDGPITLSDGRSERVAFNLVEETRLLDDISYGELNTDDKDDAAVLLVRSGGGSGVFVYAAAYVSGPVGYKGTGAIFLGDRISPQSISVSNGIVTVHYLDRAADEPFAAEPTVPSSKQFIYRNGTFQER